ncbi:MAG: peptide ABC transporter substrate-binding protein [Candidatus Schekmanbacteria bacterium]|nr:peptide ABC transporter substrate-binding protein [Candidatus Schekmanbacteria bacterium]
MRRCWRARWRRLGATAAVVVRLAWLPILLVPAVLLSGGCENANVHPAEYTWNNGAEPETLDPAIMTGNPEHKLANALFEGLASRDPEDLHPVPGVAERWEISADGKQYTFHLRDCQWSNGDPVTAQDFVYSWERVLNPLTASQYAYQLWYVKGGKAYNEGRLRVVRSPDVAPRLAGPGWDPAHDRCTGALAAAGSCAPPPSAATLAPRESLAVAAGDDSAPVEIDGWAKLADGRGWVRADELDYDAAALGLQAPAARTFVVKLENPTPFFLDLAAFYTLLPVHRATVERFGDQWIKPENIVSNGPFVLAEWRLNQWIELHRNPRYWDREHVRLSVARALPIDNATPAFNLYETGAVDQVDSLAMPLNLMDLLRTRTDYRRSPYLATYFYRMNVRRPPLDDVRVRRALALSIDRSKVTDFILKAGQLPAETFVPPGFRDYVSPPGVNVGLRVEEARALLAAAGYPGGTGIPPIELLYNTAESHKDIAEVLQQEWKKNLGIEVSLINQEWKVYLVSMHTADYTICRGGWIGDYVDPNTFLDLWLTNGGNNNTNWSSRAYDELIFEAGRTLDQGRRMQLFQRAEELLLQEMPIIPLYHYVSLNLVKPWVRGFSPNILDEHPLKHIWVDRQAREKGRAG